MDAQCRAARERALAQGLSSPRRAGHGWFLGRIGEFLVRHGGRPVGWAETGTELPLDFTVMTWRDAAHTLTAARRGHQVVSAYHRATYLDYAQSEDPARAPGPAGQGRRSADRALPRPRPRGRGRFGGPAKYWVPRPSCGPSSSRRRSASRYLTYPRLCALADRAWTGPTDWDDFRARLDDHMTRLDALGVRYPPSDLTRSGITPPSGEVQP